MLNFVTELIACSGVEGLGCVRGVACSIIII